MRGFATVALAAWRDAKGLFTLLSDPSFGVRKSAMYHLGTLPPSPAIAERAWAHLNRADVPGVHATETLNTFSRHARRNMAIPRLAAIAGDPRRDGMYSGRRPGRIDRS